MLPDNNILDIIISIALIYALLSILVSILLEWWNHYRKARAKFLKLALCQLLNDPLNVHFGELFYNHYLIDGLRNKVMKRSPQYISSQLFAEVLIDVIANRNLHDKQLKLLGESDESGKQYEIAANEKEANVVTRFKISLAKLSPSPFVDTIRSFCEKSEGDYEKLKELISFWYDDYMDRVSGWYKSSLKKYLLIFGFLVAIILNVDSLHIIRTLSLDDNLRNNLVLTAEKIADEYSALSDSSKQETEAIEKILVKVFPDSVIQKAKNTNNIKPLQKILLSDSINSAYAPLLDSLINKDSLSTEYKQRADRVLTVMSSLNLPIGYNNQSAPVSWFTKQTSLSEQRILVGGSSHKSLLEYTDKRNQLSPSNVILYIFGIIISGVSLSFGAPFWFETLVKLVNIRRAGKKPEQVNVKSKSSRS